MSPLLSRYSNRSDKSKKRVSSSVGGGDLQRERGSINNSTDGNNRTETRNIEKIYDSN